MIASVAFHNFKALRNTRLELQTFNLLIGPNGSGKTSLIQALLRLRTLVRLQGDEAENPAPRLPDGPEITFHFFPPHAGTKVCLGCISDLVCDLMERRPVDDPGWPELRRKIARIRAYLFDHYAMALPSPKQEVLELSSNGSNLAATAEVMKRQFPEAFSQWEAEVVRIMPEYSQVILSISESGTVTLAMKLRDEDMAVTADNLSQGSLYLLGMLLLAFQPEPPSILCIEEIDRGIHPRLLREVRDLFYRLSYPEDTGMPRPPVQVIASTHSPYLLDLYRDHPEEVVIAQKEGSAARFERLSDRNDLPELLAEGSLGDIWFSGILGGVPEE